MLRIFLLTTCVFLINFVQTQRNKCPQRRILHSSLRGKIKNFGYPLRYKPNQLCIYSILVPKGFFIKMSFLALKLGIPTNPPSSNCLHKDHMVISTKTLHFQDLRGINKKYQLLLCETKKPTRPILIRASQVWMRFYADGKKVHGESGFHIIYTAIDRNECKQKKSPCEQICVNTKGSFLCKCYKGYQLKENGRNCKVLKIVKFIQRIHNITIPFDDVKVGKKLLQLQTIIETVNGIIVDDSLRYEIVEKEDNNDIFRMDHRNGNLFMSVHPETHGLYSFRIEATVDDGYPTQCVVNVNIKAENKLNKRFSVLLQQGVEVYQQIFNLRPYYSKPHAKISFLSDGNNYFGVKPIGNVYIKSKLPNTFNESVMTETSFKVHVKVLDELGFESTGVATVNVVILPEFPGEEFVTPEILQEVEQEINQELIARNMADPGNSKLSFRTVGLHRLLRRPTIKAQKISKAKLYFDEVLQKVQRKVEKTYIPSRQRGDPIIVHLGTGQLVSSEPLEKVIEASKCKEVSAEPDCTSFLFGSNYQPYDGACNNINNPLWGAASTPFVRLLSPQYFDADSLSAPVGFPNLPEAPVIPSAHRVSQAFFNVHQQQWQSKTSSRYSHMLMQWGQFIDHDITMTAESEGGHHCVFPRCDNSEEDFASPCFPMMYPGRDEWCSMFIRSAAVCQTSNAKIEVRQQMNTITGFLDASMIYGSSKERSDELRQKDGRGLLKTTRHVYLPQVKATLTPPLSFCKDFGGCFDAGDVRVNEQVVLTSMHTLWVREHNRIARKLKYLNKHWEGERIFLETRKIVAAEIQHITYTEYLPKILGEKALPKYTGYNPNVNPSISNVFATAAFRFGHSLVQPSFARLNSNFDKAADDLPLINAFFNNTLLLLEGIEPFLFGMVGNVTSDVDRNLAYGLARGLFQRPGAVRGFDLAALNIQRGRDHGLPGYARWREFCNLKKAYTFEDLKDTIESDVTRGILRTLFEDQVEYTDVFVGGIAEDHVKGAMVGPLFHCIIKDQFLRLRDGDRFYYENDFLFSKNQLVEIQKASLASVMCDNLNGIVSIQPDVFKAVDEIDGKRTVCNSIPNINLDKWKEFNQEENQEWTAWHETVRLPTGTWSMHQRLCGNRSIIDIECKTMDNRSYTDMKENTRCVIPVGVYCRNEHLSDQSCSGYKVRMLCLENPSVVDYQENTVQTGFPKRPIPASLQCKTANQDDYALAFPTLEEAVIGDLYHSLNAEEYLQVGTFNQYQKRILLKFDLRRLKGTDAIHSATLQLYYVGHTQRDRHVVSSSYLEAYIITSTNWNYTNVTSRVPWMEDYLGVGKDTDARQLDNALIVNGRQRWLHLNLYRAVRQWRISRGDLERANFGIMLMIRGDENKNIGMARIASSVHDNITIRPRLLVCLSSASW